MARLGFLTYNVKGLKDDDKRSKVFHWLKKKVVIICLQEAHCEPESIAKWEEEWGGGNNSKLWY